MAKIIVIYNCFVSCGEFIEKREIFNKNNHNIIENDAA